MILNKPVYDSKEAAILNLKTYYITEKGLSNLDNFLGMDCFQKSNEYYLDYIPIEILRIGKQPSVSGVPFVLRYKEGGDIKKLSVFSLIENLPDGFREKNLYQIYKENRKDKFYVRLPSILYSFYLDNNQFEDAAKLIGTILKDNPHTAYNRTPYYGSPVDERYLFWLTYIYGALKYNNEKATTSDLKKYIDTLSDMMKDPLGRNAFDIPAIKYMHGYIERNYKSQLRSIRSTFVKRNPSVFDIEGCSEITISSILDDLFSPEQYTYYSNWRRNEVATYFSGHKEVVIPTFKNYFYSKYGRGSTSAKLRERVISLQNLLKDSGLDSEISIMDILDGMPDKIIQQALLGLVGEN